jgi:hypothetical protein
MGFALRVEGIMDDTIDHRGEVSRHSDDEATVRKLILR